MDIYNIAANRLIEKEFNSIECKEIQNIGAVLYQSNINNIILKKIHSVIELSSIKEYSQKIRNIVSNSDFNLFNTYLLICIDMEELDYETFFMIERDTSSLRKYVIRNEMDLNRIPFLDGIKGDQISNLKTQSDIELDDDLKSIYIFLNEYDGKNKKISTIDIEKFVNDFEKEVNEELENEI